MPIDLLLKIRPLAAPRAGVAALALACAAATPVAWAQGTTPNPRPVPSGTALDTTSRVADPLDPGAQVPPLVIRSSLASYRRLGDPPTTPWRDANETVNRIGGWRTYLREGQNNATPSAAPQAGSPR